MSFKEQKLKFIGFYVDVQLFPYGLLKRPSFIVLPLSMCGSISGLSSLLKF